MVTRQATCLGLQPSFGFGDRLGLATPGHLDALKGAGGDIVPIFAQQSIREMTRTQRTPQQVMKAAVAALESEGYVGSFGADADHLKTAEDAQRTAEAGFCFFTIDPSEHVDIRAETYTASELAQHYREAVALCPWAESYRGQTRRLAEGVTVTFDDTTLQRAVVKYGRAIAHTVAIARHLDRVTQPLGQNYEIELSVDETPNPTTTAEHYLVAEQCLQAGVKLVSLAPRFVGDFEKGIDFKGDLAAFERSLHEHAVLARTLGPYKISLHSGSDKLSIYGIFAQQTRGVFHVKTAGTSYLEGLRVAARHEPKLFAAIVDFSRGRFETDKASYHISAQLTDVPPASEISQPAERERLYLDENAGRQILHVAFGSVLTHPMMAPELFAVLKANPQTHREVLAKHLGKHLTALHSRPWQ